MLEIPGYIIQKQIAKGGMSQIYAAQQETLGRRVVLKVMHARGSDHDLEVQRFLQEGRIIASLRHPHIINVFDFGSHGNHLYLAMEYLRGGDLGAKLHESTFPPYRALQLTLQIAKALRYAHDRKIVHRDVKPGNILFRAKHSVVLTDFGIAKRLNVDASLTLAGYIVGSPHYLSPEQATGEKLDGRSDIYSLGIIVYEMLTGVRPFEGDRPMDILRQHVDAPVPRLPKSLAHFQFLLHRMLAKSPKARFRDTNTLIRYLKVLQTEISASSSLMDVAPVMQEEDSAWKLHDDPMWSIYTPTTSILREMSSSTRQKKVAKRHKRLGAWFANCFSTPLRIIATLLFGVLGALLLLFLLDVTST